MKKTQISDLRDHLGFWMRFVSNHVSQAFARKLAKQGVTVAEWVILREMYEHQDKTFPGIIVKQTGLTKGAVSKLVDRLHAKRLIKRLCAKEDKRFQEIALTEEGRALVPKLAHSADRNDREFFGCLAQQERKGLERILKLIISKNQLNQTPIN